MKGFTLIEFIIVIFLASVLGAVAIARWPSASTNVDAIANQIADDIRYTQALAMQRHQRFRINFFSDRYRISNIDDTVPFQHPTASGTDIMLNNSLTLSTPLTFIVFDSRGIPYQDASIPGTPLAATTTFTLTASDGSNGDIIVNPNTGKVSLG